MTSKRLKHKIYRNDICHIKTDKNLTIFKNHVQVPQFLSGNLTDSRILLRFFELDMFKFQVEGKEADHLFGGWLTENDC